MGGIWLEYLIKNMELFLIMSIFEYMMICLIELNQLINIKHFCSKFSYNEITEDESQSEAIEKQKDKIQNKKRIATKYSTKQTLQRKRQKLVDYRENSLDDFRLMIVYPHPKLHIDELEVLSKCYGQAMKK